MSRVKKGRHRRKLYAGGTLMVLAPMGVTGCGTEQAGDTDAVAVVPVDVVSDAPDGYVDPDVIAIAPFDPGQLDLDVPELIAIAPADPGTAEVIAIAPMDPGPQDPGNPPEVIAIAPFDPGPQDPGNPPEVIAIAPMDTGSTDVVQPGDSCYPEGVPCSDDLVCQAQAICIVATECCGGCTCEPMNCNPANPWCPPGMECTEVDGKDICTSNPPQEHPAGFMEPCDTNEECLQEYFCEQTMFCIAPPPGDGEAPSDDNPCNQKNCVPMACYGPEKDQCPTDSICVPYGDFMGMPGEGSINTCLRDAGEIPGGYGASCNNSKECLADQYFCHSGMVMCILPCTVCLPLKCGPEEPKCPPDSTCENVGITNACVKK